MTGSDNARMRPTPAFRVVGTGHVSNWTCAACARPQSSQLGRKLKYVLGARQYVCKRCVEVRK